MSELRRPTLLSSCAMATTAAEAGYRVEYPNSLIRSSRIFALDQGAAEAMYAITEDPWNGAHFLTLAAEKAIVPDATSANDLPLTNPDGRPARLEEELSGADVVVLLSSTGENGGAAEVIAREAYYRNIMTAGLALGGGKSKAAVDGIVNTMRPFASVLVVASEDDYIPAMLTALRA